jgi:hypothetical protein
MPDLSPAVLLPMFSPAPLEAAHASLKVLDLEEHQAVIVSHNDGPRQHVHVLINRVHPVQM